MAGVSKPVSNAIRGVAFLLGEMEETQINNILKEAFNSQITELTSDMASLIEDAKEKLNVHFKSSRIRKNASLTSSRRPHNLDTPKQPHTRQPLPILLLMQTREWRRRRELRPGSFSWRDYQTRSFLIRMLCNSK
jgi:hypothetical protein